MIKVKVLNKNLKTWKSILETLVSVCQKRDFNVNVYK